MEYVPIQVRSGVKRGSEEGTEVDVKCKYITEMTVEKTSRMGAFLSWFGLMICFGVGCIGIMGLAIHIGLLTFLALFIIGGLIIVVGVILYNRGRKIVKILKEEERQITIFFPSISIDNIYNIKAVYPDPDLMHEETMRPTVKMMLHPFRGGYLRIEPYDKHFVDLWLCSEWRSILAVDKTTKEIWVEGKGDDGEIYYARLYCLEELCNKLIKKREELMQQAKLMALEEHRRELEYLEKVGHYEEAARIYESLDMPEKAAEMRRKKREIVMLDLNALIKQLGERGFTVTYNCAHCGAPVRISGETKAEAIQYCSHCGSRIETIDIANFIKKYLS